MVSREDHIRGLLDNPQRDPDRDMKVRSLTPEIIADLDEIFPERCPDPDDSEREVWMKAGERRVVRFLMEQFRIQHSPREPD